MSSHLRGIRVFASACILLVLTTSISARADGSPAAAERLFQERKYEEALEAFDRLIEENPFKGFPWARKGLILLRLKRYREAIAAYRESERLGASPRWTAAGLGYGYMGLEDVDQAAWWFRRSTTIDPSMMGTLLRYSPDIKSFLGPERSASIFGPEPNDRWTRTEGWRTDLRFLHEVIRRSHYDFDVKTSSDAWDRHAEELSKRVPTLGDEEVALELTKLAALAGDGHTNLWPQLGEGSSFHMLPLLLYPFKDGVFVRASPAEHSDLIGSRVVRIGEMPIEKVVERVARYHGHDNPMHNLLLLPYELATAEILKQLGATDSVRRIRVTVADRDGGEITHSIEPTPWPAGSPFGEKLSAPDWVAMNREASADPPLWLRRPKDIYWFEYLEDEEVVYFHYDQVHDKEEEPFGEFVKRLFALVDAHPNAALVIDLRMNDGGSSDLYPPLIKAILAHPTINREGRLFTIIGRMTYSAAMNLAVDLENWTETIFVGEPTGSSPNFIGENKTFTLPYSGLSVSVSDRFHQRAGSTDKRIWIPPDLVAELTAEAFSRNEDPALSRIIEYLDRHRPSSAGSSH